MVNSNVFSGYYVFRGQNAKKRGYKVKSTTAKGANGVLIFIFVFFPYLVVNMFVKHEPVMVLLKRN